MQLALLTYLQSVCQTRSYLHYISCCNIDKQTLQGFYICEEKTNPEKDPNHVFLVGFLFVDTTHLVLQTNKPVVKL